MDGVKDATVSLEETNVTVDHDDSVDLAQLTAAIEEQGYEVAS